MSGNMSFFKNGSGIPDNRSHQQLVPPPVGGINRQSVSNVRGNSRSSYSFTDGSSILSSFVEEDDKSKVNWEGFVDKDVWGTRIVLSALLEIVFSEVPHPKLPVDVIQGIQNFLLAMNTAVSACNPFVEYEKRENTTGDITDEDINGLLNHTLGGSSKGGSQVAKLVIPPELIESLNPECKVVLRSLLSANVRKQLGKIRDFWKPILEINGESVPASQETTAMQRRSVCSTSESAQWRKLYDLILKQTLTYKNRAVEIDGEMEEILRKRNEAMKKYDRDVNIMRELTIENFKEHKTIENPDFGKSYIDLLNLETERTSQQIRLHKLKAEVEERGSDELQKERLSLYTQVKSRFEKMLLETEEMEDRLHKYNSLGPEFSQLLEDYKTLDEEVKLKEWVVEQLANGPEEDSLFNESLND